LKIAKKPKKEKKSKGIWELYESSGGLKRKNKSCPKCGSGTFMAQHKGRVTCGKCRYSEFTRSDKEKAKN